MYSLENDNTLQTKVQIFLKDRKILKKDFAVTIGITPVKLSHWLNGRVCLDLKTNEKILKMISHS